MFCYDVVDPAALGDSEDTQAMSEIKPTEDNQSSSKRATGKTKKVVKRVIRKTVVRSTKSPKSAVSAKTNHFIVNIRND